LRTFYRRKNPYPVGEVRIGAEETRGENTISADSASGGYGDHRKERGARQRRDKCKTDVALVQVQGKP